jgi:hypothetical protein
VSFTNSNYGVNALVDANATTALLLRQAVGGGSLATIPMDTACSVIYTGFYFT